MCARSRWGRRRRWRRYEGAGGNEVGGKGGGGAQHIDEPVVRRPPKQCKCVFFSSLRVRLGANESLTPHYKSTERCQICSYRSVRVLGGSHFRNSAQDVALKHATLGDVFRFVQPLLWKGRASSDRWSLHVRTGTTPRSPEQTRRMHMHLQCYLTWRQWCGLVPQYATQVEQW